MNEQELRELEEICGSFEFAQKLTQLSESGENGDKQSVEILISMLRRCAGKDQWFSRNTWCSMAARALIKTRTRESLQFMLQFIRELPDNTPFGAVDLIAGLLPVYGRIITGHALELAAEGERELLRALGIQTLCNMYLGGILSAEHSLYLEKLIKDFKGDRYFTQHITELVRASMLQAARIENDNEGLMFAADGQSLNDEILNMIQEEL